jgi:hypothetical protein
MAQHYNTFTADYATGDLNADGNVDFGDLILLAQNYQKSLPPLPVMTVTFAVPTTAPALPAPPIKKKPAPIFATRPIAAKPTAKPAKRVAPRR